MTDETSRALEIAREAIAKYGPDTDKPSVHLAKAVVALSDDWPLAAFDEQTQVRAALMCLASNLAIGAALCRAFFDGFSVANGARPLTWRPGCNRPATQEEG